MKGPPTELVEEVRRHLRTQDRLRRRLTQRRAQYARWLKRSDAKPAELSKLRGFISDLEAALERSKRAFGRVRRSKL